MQAGETTPWYSSASFWTGPFTIVLTLLVGGLLAVGWYILGGLPRDHDRYGKVAVPGTEILSLPEGDVRLDFENDAVGAGDNRSIADQPEGLDVRVTSADGEEVDVEDVPSWIFSSISGDRGHEPWGKVELPSDGDYSVETIADGTGGFRRGAGAGGSPAAEEPQVESGPAISVGAKPWNPGGSKLLGAILCFLAVATLIAAIMLPIRLLAGRGR